MYSQYEMQLYQGLLRPDKVKKPSEGMHAKVPAARTVEHAYAQPSNKSILWQGSHRVAKAAARKHPEYAILTGKQPTLAGPQDLLPHNNTEM